MSNAFEIYTRINKLSEKIEVIKTAVIMLHFFLLCEISLIIYILIWMGQLP